MPIQKFRNLDAMRKALWQSSSGEDLPRRIRRLWARSVAISPRVYPRGVFKYRSLEEAQRAREQMVTDNVQRLLQERLAAEKIRNDS